MPAGSAAVVDEIQEETRRAIDVIEDGNRRSTRRRRGRGGGARGALVGDVIAAHRAG